MTAIPAEAYTALGEAIQAYEPEAMALIIRSPAALLQVLLEAGRRAAVAAAPLIAAAERDRIIALMTSDDFVDRLRGILDPDDALPAVQEVADLIRRAGP